MNPLWAVTLIALALVFHPDGESHWPLSQAMVWILSASTFSVGSHLIVVISLVHLEALGHFTHLKHIRHKAYKNKFHFNLPHGTKPATYNRTLMCLLKTL
jgi:hypothetical protein